MSLYPLPGSKWANVDLVGEFYRRDEIVALFGGMPRGSEPLRADFQVQLVPEPDNPFSKSGRAVSARIDGVVVGYLSESDAQRWYLDFHRIAASGAVAVTAANVFAFQASKWRDGRMRREVEVNIRVALPDPGFITPLNARPVSNTAVLPWGRALQVTGEDKHFDYLFDYVPEGGSGLLVLTMHIMKTMLRNGRTKEIIEVRLDGERVGQLTEATSQHYVPAVLHAQDMGRSLGVWAVIQGSGLAAELTIQGLRSSELPVEWLSEMPLLPPLVPFAAAYDVPPAFIGEPARGVASLVDRFRRASVRSVPVNDVPTLGPVSAGAQVGPAVESASVADEAAEIEGAAVLDEEEAARAEAEHGLSQTTESLSAKDAEVVAERRARLDAEHSAAAAQVAAAALAAKEAAALEVARLKEQRKLARQEARAASAPERQAQREAVTAGAVKAGKATGRLLLIIIGCALGLLVLLFGAVGISLFAEGQAGAGVASLIFAAIGGAGSWFIFRKLRSRRS